ncbi:MAG: hypothetical protein R3C10_06290 [Pirellulales bacterium]|nr:hypothetical protein [Planctomycetales bacterium]
MSEKSAEPGSLVVLLRALVMFVFLVGLPGVAVIKGSFPELADRLAVRGREVLAALTAQVSQAHGAASTTQETGEATLRTEFAPMTIQSDQPAPSIPPEFAAQMPQPGPVPLPTGLPEPMPIGDHSMTTADALAVQGFAAVPGRSLPAGYGAAIDVPSGGDAAYAVPEATGVGPAAPLDPQLAERLTGVLRDNGATYYRLERWGDDGRLYRFQCKMAVGGNPQVNRHFEATDADANRAIQRVVENVRQWQQVGLR